jgi:DNA-binding winged helix-turn-helix (wHTH) protein
MAAYCFGRFELNPATRQLLVEGQPIALGARAFDVLLALVERRGRLISKNDLLDAAWPGLAVEENNLQVQVSALRKVVGDHAITTVPGRGYQFTAEVTESQAPSRKNSHRSNFPRPLTRFIGHEADLGEYEKTVTTNRLVTLTGVGGCGKTRLACEIASRLLPRYADGAWFVDLTPMADAEQLALTVAKALGINEHPGQPVIETLCEHLDGHKILLVLDNCEHVVSACAMLAQTLLDRANHLTVVATSRERLDGMGECTLRVRSLSCPPAEDGDAFDRIPAFEAVQLFVDRAQLVQRAFALSPATAPAVADICRRLDGIPLAIELAAARVRSLSVQEVSQRLDQRFHLLRGGDSARQEGQAMVLEQSIAYALERSED